MRDYKGSMDDSYPASSSTTSTGHPESPVRVARHSRIHFPSQDQGHRHASSSTIEGSPSSLPLALPRAQHASLASQNGLEPSSQSDLRRRRVRSADVTNIRLDLYHSRGYPDIAGTAATTTGSPRHARKVKGKEIEAVSDEFGPGAFSNEYDLSQDDPRIIQDVQRALRLKARRENRLRNIQSGSPQKDSRSDKASASSDLSAGSLPAPISFITTADPITIGSSTAGTSEIDFSPSVRTTPLHPVPSTSDKGVTLDWSGSTSDDDKSERRWALSITKRKGKDKVPPTPSAVEKQVTLYGERLSRIKDEASSQTLRKAAITSDQLRRRYDTLSTSVGSRQRRLNLANVVRWYGSQEPLVRSSLDNAEPLTWLKHLLDKRKSSNRSPWHLSALIMEEYVKYHNRSDGMSTIPEDTSSEWVSPPNASPSPSASTPQWNPSRPRISSHYSFGPSLSRKRSPEGHISFEPSVESARNSVEGDSRRSVESPSRVFRHSLPGVTSSPHSSMHSIFSGSLNYPMQHMGATSPSSSRLHLREFANRIGRRRPQNDSDGASSTRESLSEEHTRSDGEERRRKRGISRPANLELPPTRHGQISNQEPRVIPGELLEPFELKPSNHRGQLISKSRSNDTDGEPTAMPRSDSQQPSLETPAPSSRRAIYRRRERISLPSSDHLILGEEQKRQREEGEEMQRYEYELRSQTLDDAIAQNQRIRYLLQRVASGIKECELLQSRLMKSLGLPRRSIPHELLDAFSHDPSSVTGSTRRFGGYKAVEDIHNRIVRQRETFRIFLAVTEESEAPHLLGSVLDSPITSLMSTLEALENHRRDIEQKAQGVAETLTNVKKVHTDVKQEYNETLSHTSVVYPELSQIVALEESYKDQYQQFWELGMDALTFLLDTVTPFWRNYGKTIGEDVQDFLIIPLYRNEFTGEPKRYPITRLPRRSARHWLGLLLFSFTTAAVTFLQMRAATQSTLYYNMPIITHSGLWWLLAPFFWIGIFIQWSAVFIELFIWFAELAVVVWWIGWSVKIFS